MQGRGESPWKLNLPKRHVVCKFISGARVADHEEGRNELSEGLTLRSKAIAASRPARKHYKFIKLLHIIYFWRYVAVPDKRDGKAGDSIPVGLS